MRVKRKSNAPKPVAQTATANIRGVIQREIRTAKRRIDTLERLTKLSKTKVDGRLIPVQFDKKALAQERARLRELEAALEEIPRQIMKGGK